MITLRWAQGSPHGGRRCFCRPPLQSAVHHCPPLGVQACCTRGKLEPTSARRRHAGSRKREPKKQAGKEMFNERTRQRLERKVNVKERAHRKRTGVESAR